MIRTRFAPSPTGTLHIGGARTALFSWAFARKFGGQFILRIEDTDLERSTEVSVQAILDSMRWLGLDWDNQGDELGPDGQPVHQMQRLHRYREIADQLIATNAAYWCYASRDELDAMREAQRARGEKPRYDGRWRPERAAALGLVAPAGARPVLRFRNPDDGVVTWDDLVKGPISIANSELDDLVIMRADGVPTYNFGVVVDDIDMRMTHVIRGDDHVNNTPRQINVFNAIGASLPRFGHVPMILGTDGERLSKRHGAVSVMQYHDDGYLPAATINYLARLGWSHGNEEIFSVAQFIEWFDVAHISRSPAQFNTEKLSWLNNHYIRTADVVDLCADVGMRIAARGGQLDGGPPLALVIELLRDRASTLNALADSAMLFYGAPAITAAAAIEQSSAVALTAMRALRSAFEQLPDWEHDAIGSVINAVLKTQNLKLGSVAPTLRLVVFGQAQTPAINQVLALAGRTRVLERLATAGN